MVTTSTLVEEYCAVMRQMTLDKDVDELLHHGIPMQSIAAVYPARTRIRLNQNGNLYEPDEAGRSVWTFPPCRSVGHCAGGSRRCWAQLSRSTSIPIRYLFIET